MMHETLFRETFSQLHASDEAKREVLSMIETRNIRRPRRLGRAVGLAAALIALAALALGLKMPNLTWTNETTPIKQSGSVMLALFANWFYAIALGGLYFLCGRYLSAAAYLALAAAITAAVCALLLRWVKKQGARIFAAL